MEGHHCSIHGRMGLLDDYLTGPGCTDKNYQNSCKEYSVIERWKQKEKDNNKQESNLKNKPIKKKFKQPSQLNLIRHMKLRVHN